MPEGIIILLVIILVTAIIAGIAFTIYHFLNPKLKRDDKPDEATSVQEELNRVLKPIDDEKTAREVSSYKEKDD